VSAVILSSKVTIKIAFTFARLLRDYW